MTSSDLDLDFNAVTEKDIDEIQEYLNLCCYEESNHNIINMMLWLEWYPLFKYKTENYCLLLGIHEQQMFLYMPLCHEIYFDEAIMKAKSIFDRYHVPFVLSCFTEKMMQHVLRLFPEYQACPAPDSFDYVYLTEKLITFSGKKLQKKRNHLNAFYAEYGQRYQYESLHVKNVQECLNFMDKWKIDVESDDFFLYERRGVKRILLDFEVLNYKGGCIRIDGEIKAFAIGSVLSERMCQINIEKADDLFRGLYQAIMKEVLEHEFKNYLYCNREDDLGRENLRQAKRAYAPEFMIEKFRLCHRGEEE